MRARLGLTAALAATALGGCSASGTTSSVTISGHRLTIYLAAPAGGGRVEADVLAAERLAFNQRAHELSAFTVQLKTLSGNRPSDDARTAIQDPAAVAYLGEIAPGTSQASVGITNAQQLLQVSPTDTAQGLTSSQTPGLTNVPNKYLESVKTYGRTFARVVPNTGVEARLDTRAMTKLGARSLYVASDGSDYARALAASLRADASGLTVTTGPLDSSRAAASGADAVFAATDAPAAGRSFLAALAGGHPNLLLFAPSALADPATAAGLPAHARLYVSAPGFSARSAPAATAGFATSFQAAYGHAPVTQAVFGYEAMAAVLDVLQRAGSAANNRGLVVHDFLTIRNRTTSVVGPYSIDANGDTNLTPFVLEQARGGTLAPVTQLSG